MHTGGAVVAGVDVVDVVVLGAAVLVVVAGAAVVVLVGAAVVVVVGVVVVPAGGISCPGEQVPGGRHLELPLE